MKELRNRLLLVILLCCIGATVKISDMMETSSIHSTNTFFEVSTTVSGSLATRKVNFTNMVNAITNLNSSQIISATPTAHQASHQEGGSDPVAGLLTANAKVAVNKNSGATVGTRRRINLIEGSNVTLTVADDSGNEEVDVTIASSGGSSGYATVQEEGSSLTQRSALNFVGSALTATDDAGNTRTQVATDSDVNALADLASNGLYARTGSGTSAARTIANGAGIGVSNGDGVSGNPTISVDLSTYVNNLTIWDSANASRTITFGLSGATDPVLTLGNGVFNITTGTLQQGGVAVTLQDRTITIAGTANEITSSAGAQDFSANRTWTLSLPSALTFIGKTVTGGTFSSPNITTPNITTGLRDSAGNEMVDYTAASSAVNQFSITNAATGLSPTITTAGDDANINLTLSAKGAGVVKTIKSFVTAPVALSDAATIATDASLGNHYRVTLGGNRTLGNPTNPIDGMRIVWEVIQDGTGSRTLAYDTKFAFGTDLTGATLTTTASKRDFITAIYNLATDKWYVVAFIKGY